MDSTAQSLPVHVSQDTQEGMEFLGGESGCLQFHEILPNCSPESPFRWGGRGVALWEFWLVGGGGSQILHPSCPGWLWLQCSHTPLFLLPHNFLIFLQAQLWIWKEVCYTLSYISLCFSKAGFGFLWLVAFFLSSFFSHSFLLFLISSLSDC